ncbi:uncharacterized protein LOC119976703 [Scyliorhinus canicula]|uniref:uncharacterized protein LOC119976703 n=1 Tax=Scyliorhinus canicula TaxID=7830 RepID=UPI0018F46F2E|nr:uncharacterized protein LOC119976703 [Scyliorhinus canicula]
MPNKYKTGQQKNKETWLNSEASKALSVRKIVEAPGVSVATPLTMVMLTGILVEELQKLRQDVSEDHEREIEGMMSLICPTFAKVEDVVKAQGVELKEVEVALTKQSEKITYLEVEVVNDNMALRARMNDLENRFRRQNLRVVGLPECLEGLSPTKFMAQLVWKMVREGKMATPLELYQAHNSLRQKPRAVVPLHAISMRFHSFEEKEKVLLWSMSIGLQMGRPRCEA